jgi:arginase
MKNSNANAMNADIFGYDCGWGCGDTGCEDGPLALETDQILHALAQAHVAVQNHGTLGLKHLAAHKALDTKEKTLPVLRECLQRLETLAHHAARQGHIPVVIGGDHSCAMATWPGIIAATQAREKFGLIWLDAHLDSHTYETSSQGKWGGWWHGQPVAALTGHGLPELTNIGGAGAKIDPRHISIIGAHSFEPAEQAFVETHGIRVFYIEEVRARGFAAVFAEAMARATDGTKGFGVSIDLDGFAPGDSPGVGTREDTGMPAAEVLPIIKHLARHPAFRGLEIVEFNPHKDVSGKTARLVTQIIASVFAKY